ncbi:hypothetical protein SAMN04488564_101991 [Lentzea waywayandensis]|uniref:Uncharacterized protein n=1 Tax=Lentzea waywayandensis TaxID=84724 RepID=A0A1I6D3S1_9PSEU|nr:hypothetical protein [Lentzea waywayandensis]SFR00013.1 hypothetical protein SAMN04488564_101991 [Lentzea waywayandensis]
MSNPAPSPLPFAEVTAETYAEAFSATCEPTETRRGVLLTGTCPRCGDRMDYLVPTGVFLGASGTSARVRPTPVMCTCNGSHEGRPDADEGCGAYWTVELTAVAS